MKKEYLSTSSSTSSLLSNFVTCSAQEEYLECAPFYCSLHCVFCVTAVVYKMDDESVAVIDFQQFSIFLKGTIHFFTFRIAVLRWCMGICVGGGGMVELELTLI